MHGHCHWAHFTLIYPAKLANFSLQLWICQRGRVMNGKCLCPFLHKNDLQISYTANRDVSLSSTRFSAVAVVAKCACIFMCVTHCTHVQHFLNAAPLTLASHSSLYAYICASLGIYSTLYMYICPSYGLSINGYELRVIFGVFSRCNQNQWREQRNDEEIGTEREIEGKNGRRRRQQYNTNHQLELILFNTLAMRSAVLGLWTQHIICRVCLKHFLHGILATVGVVVGHFWISSYLFYTVLRCLRFICASSWFIARAAFPSDHHTISHKSASKL